MTRSLNKNKKERTTATGKDEDATYRIETIGTRHMCVCDGEESRKLAMTHEKDVNEESTHDLNFS